MYSIYRTEKRISSPFLGAASLFYIAELCVASIRLRRALSFAGYFVGFEVIAEDYSWVSCRGICYTKRCFSGVCYAGVCYAGVCYSVSR